MTKNRWRNKIKKACQEAGTYRPYFDQAIDTLALILKIRDDALEKFTSEGGEAVIEHTNKAGATNITKNPALTLLMDCNAQALNYWRDLGLTPKGLRQLSGEAMKEPEQTDTLESVFAELGI